MLALSLLATLALADAPPVGFVSHYPFVRADDETYGASGATVALVRAPWSTIQPSPDAWDDSTIDQQLAWAKTQGIRLLYVIECGPAHCANWVRDEVKAAGELTRDHAGNSNDPSIFSGVYRARMDAFVRRVVGAIESKDREGVVLGYSNGCEWWYPSAFTFGEPDRLGFEQAMRAKYGSDAAAREAWGVPAEGKLERPPVVFEGVGAANRLGELIELGRQMDSSWCTTDDGHPSVEAGKAYSFEVEVKVDGARRGGAYLEIAWLPTGSPRPMRLTQSTRVESTEGWQSLRVEGAAPEGCDRAWLLLKSSAEGAVSYRNVHFHASGSEAELAPNTALDEQSGKWHFIPWTVGQPGALKGEWREGAVAIDYTPTIGTTVSPAWVEDWFGFTGDAVAEFIGHLADEIRVAAPGKPIVTYLTFSFGAPFNWDYSYDLNIHPEKVFRARHYEGLGMQLCAADGDYHHITAGIDMVRDLGPAWMIDLQDFTSGVAIGPRAMTETTRAGIAAGARGAVYYCWFGTPEYDFHGAWPADDVRGMVDRSRELLEATANSAVPVDVVLLHPMVVPFAGAGERDPGRFFLLYKALRRLGLGVRIVTTRADAPAGVPLLTVDDVPPAMRPRVRRSTEAGNTPPVFKLPLGDPGNAGMLEELTRLLAAKLGVPVPDPAEELFPRVGADGARSAVEVTPPAAR
jgi:hypothetical protein